MLRKTLLLLFYFICSIVALQANEIQQLLSRLDAKIKEKPMYMSRKEARIDSLLQEKNNLVDLDSIYVINRKVHAEYSTYRFDSALVYVFHNQEIAEKLDRQMMKDEVRLEMSELLSITGMFSESQHYLQMIDRRKIDSSLLEQYFSAFELFYYGMRSLDNDDYFASQYRQKEKQYADSVYQVAQVGSLSHKYYSGYRLLQEGNLQESRDQLLQLLGTMRSDTKNYAMIAINIASIYKQQGDMINYEKYLIIAAISDIEVSQKENMAMQELSILLFDKENGDIDRAYSYVRNAMEDALFFNNRLRLVQISGALTEIVVANDAKSKAENKNLRISLIIITILLGLMGFAMQRIYIQMKALNRNKRELHALNEELQLLNIQLQHANKNKEEYVGMFMDLCSSYLNKMSQNRETVIRKILTKQIDELYELNSSNKVMQAEILEFYHNFDSAFLNLYPSFISEFNQLLCDDTHIVVKKNALLNTELRIFALIRLGIMDSSQIASFLRYAPQTIYNYRTGIKNKAKGNRDTFEDDIMCIGL